MGAALAVLVEKQRGDEVVVPTSPVPAGYTRMHFCPAQLLQLSRGLYLVDWRSPAQQEAFIAWVTLS